MSPVEPLTRREREVLAAIAEGDTLAEAAHRLYLSPSYCKNLALSARHHLDARSNAQAVAIMVRQEAAGRS